MLVGINMLNVLFKIRKSQFFTKVLFPFLKKLLNKVLAKFKMITEKSLWKYDGMAVN